MKEIKVNKKYNEKKLNKIILEQIPECNYNNFCKLLRKKDIKVNGKRINKDIVIYENDVITIYLPENIENKEIKIDIVYEDDNIIMVNKPANLEVTGNASLTELIHKKYANCEFKPMPCHRIDRNTIGLVLFAKNEESLNILLEKFKKYEIEKHYLAHVYGIPKIKKQRLEAYLFKDNKKAQVYISDNFKKGAQKIITIYNVIEERKDNTSILDVEIQTGKTHQIRAHLAYIGYPIIGDGKYGKNEINKKFHKKYQELCSYKMKFNFKTESGILNYLAQKEIILKSANKENMTSIEKENLYVRNNRIIEVIMKEMKDKCPDAIDLIGIAGSFCNGDIYKKSDLDLVIISNNDSAKCLDKCFIIDDVAFDIYTQGWQRFETMAKYKHPYVTKLFDLNIVYSRNKDVVKKYKFYQALLQSNMNNTELVNAHIGSHFTKVLGSVSSLQNVSNMGVAYRKLSRIIKEIEFILFMINRTYVKRGTKRIPEEIASLKILPKDFLPIYNDMVNCKTLEEIKSKSLLITSSIKELLDNMSISYELIEDNKKDFTKKVINATDLLGTYEEIYSNWKNKMYHAIDINSVYLSFVTMSACQEFYDEMSDRFDIPRIELLEKYNPDDLKGNANSFDNSLNEWKKLYDMFELTVQYYSNLEEFENLYKEK